MGETSLNIDFVLDSLEGHAHINLINQLMDSRNVNLAINNEEFDRKHGYWYLGWEIVGKVEDVDAVIDFIHDLSLVQLKFNLVISDEMLSYKNSEMVTLMPYQESSGRLAEIIQNIRFVMMNLLDRLLPSSPTRIDITEYINPSSIVFVPYLETNLPVYVRQESIPQLYSIVDPRNYLDAFFLSNSMLPLAFPDDILSGTPLLLSDIRPYYGILLGKTDNKIPIDEIGTIQERVNIQVESKSSDGYLALKIPKNLIGTSRELANQWNITDVRIIEHPQLDDYVVVKFNETWKPSVRKNWFLTSCSRIMNGCLPRYFSVSPPINMEIFLAASIRAYATLVTERPHLSASFSEIDFSPSVVWFEFASLGDWVRYVELQSEYLRRPIWIRKLPIAVALSLRRRAPREVVIIKIPIKDMSTWTIVADQNPDAWMPSEIDIDNVQTDFRDFIRTNCHESFEAVSRVDLDDAPLEQLVTLIKTDEDVPYCYFASNMRSFIGSGINPTTRWPLTQKTKRMFDLINVGFVRGSGIWGDGFFPGIIPDVPILPNIKPVNQPIYLNSGTEENPSTMIAFRGNDQNPRGFLNIRGDKEMINNAFEVAWQTGGLMSPWGVFRSNLGLTTDYPFSITRMTGLTKSSDQIRFINQYLKIN